MMKKKAFHIEIVELAAEEIPEASSVTALAMSTNPLHLAIFKGADTVALQKQIKLFEFALKLPNAKKYSVKQNDQIIGVMAYASSKYCQLRPLQLIKAIPTMYVALGTSLLPVLKWRKNWGKHDCRKPHLHFGPLAIHPQFQGKGIGTLLLQEFCTYADCTRQDAYLETDKEENVGLYEKFGFEVIATDQNFGVTNWFMFRNVLKQY